MPQKEYYPQVNRLRGIAILMVILYHAVIVYPIDLHEITWCRNLHTFLWTVEMPLFFLISGFCMSYYGDYKSYIKKKGMRILIPHLVYGVLDVASRSLPTNLVNEQYDMTQAVKEFFFYGANDWFLGTLFMLFVIAPAIYILMRKGKTGVIIACILGICLYQIQDIIPRIFLLRNFAQFAVYFVIGMALRCYSRPEKRISLLSGIAVSALAVAGYWFTQFGNKNYIASEITFLTIRVNRLLYLFFCLIAVLLVSIVVLWLAEHLTWRPVHAFLEWCSHYSLQMYLLDGYALVITRMLAVRVLGMTNPALIIVWNFVLDLLIVLAVTRFLLQRWKWTRILSGITK